MQHEQEATHGAEDQIRHPSNGEPVAFVALASCALDAAAPQMTTVATPVASVRSLSRFAPFELSNSAGYSMIGTGGMEVAPDVV